MSYKRFAAMIAMSTIVLFGLMYMNTFALDHIEFSQTRSWMAILMGAAMAAILLAFMWSQYDDKRINAAILIGAAIAFAGALSLVRSQETVGDVAYMKAMIPHSSAAIMMAEHAHIRDPRVRALADEITRSELDDIARMKALIETVEQTPPAPAAPILPSFRKRQREESASTLPSDEIDG